MWALALGEPSEPGTTSNGGERWGLRTIEGKRGREVEGILRAAAVRMRDDAATYRAMEPRNDWGDADGARNFLEQIADLCRDHPDWVVRMSF